MINLVLDKLNLRCPLEIQDAIKWVAVYVSLKSMGEIRNEHIHLEVIA